MSLHDNATRIPRLGALALAVAIAGCGTAASPVAPSGQNLAILNAAVDDQRSAQGSELPVCTSVSITDDFKEQPVPAGDWLWFTSVFHPNDFVGRFRMASSFIDITEGDTNYHLQTPGMRVSIHTQAALHRNWAGLHTPHGEWWLMTPENTSGNDLLNAFAWQVPPGGTAGKEKVTWEAKFYSKTPQKFTWQWSAAAYKELNEFPRQDDYNNVDVKPLDAAYGDWQTTDPAGTPLETIDRIEKGGTGEGGKDYTGQLGPPLDVTPCQLGS